MATAKKYQHANDKALYDIESTCKAAREITKSTRFSRPLNLLVVEQAARFGQRTSAELSKRFYQDKQTQAKLSKRFYQDKHTQNTQS